MRKTSLTGLTILLAVGSLATIGPARAASPDTRAGSPAAMAHPADRPGFAQMRPRGHAARFWPYGHYRRYGYGNSDSYSDSDTIDDLPAETESVSPPPATGFTIQFSARDPNARHTYYSSWVDRCEARYSSFDPHSGTFEGRDGGRHRCR